MANKIKGLTLEIGGEVGPLNKALAGVNKTSRDLQSELRGVERLLKLDPSNTELLNQKQKILAESVANTSDKLSKLKDAEKDAQKQFKEGKVSEEQYRALQREVIKTEEELKKMNKQLQEMDWKSVTDGLDKFGKKSTEVGKDMSKKVTVPILGIGVAAAKIGMDFEQSMSKVEAMSGATSKEMGKLEKAARDAGASTSKSASDAADALGFMALAGWDVNKSIDGLMPVLRLSEAGNIDLARASSLVTDSMSAMGIQVEDLEGYLDIVAQAARSSNTDIDQMAEAYIKVGGTLRGLDVELEESALALGFLANAGIKGAEAGTGLNAVMLNLTAPTGRAKEALDELGYSAFDSEGNFKGLETVLFDLQAATKDMDAEQRNMTLSMIGGKEHVKTLNALMNGLDDSYDSLKTSINEADGALNEVAETMMENNKGGLIELGSALEELALKIYDVLKPVIAGLIEKIQEWVDWLDGLSPEMQQTIIIVAGLAAAIGPLLIIIGQMSLGVSGLIKLFGPLIAGLGGATGATGGLSAAIAFLTGPIGITMAAIAALIAITALIIKNWEPIKGFFKDIWGSIKNTFANVGEWFGDKFDEGWQAIKRVFLGVGSFFSGVWATIKSLFTDVGVMIGDSVSGAFKAAVNAVLTLVDNTINGFIISLNKVVGLINKIPGVNLGTVQKINIPKLKTGLSYVPHDGFLAELHKGERVLTAEENKKLNEGSLGGGYNPTFNIYSKVMTPAEMMQAATNQYKIDKLRGLAT